MKANGHPCPSLHFPQERVPAYRSIRLKILILAIFAMVGSTALSWIVGIAMASFAQTIVTDYRPGMQAMDSQADTLAQRLRGIRLQDNSAEIQRLLSQFSLLDGDLPMSVILTNTSGQVLAKGQGANATDIDLFDAARITSEVQADRTRYQPGSLYAAYAMVEMLDTRAYVLITAVPPSVRRVEHRFTIPQVVTAWVSFFGLFFFLTRGKIRYLEELADGLSVISRGDLHHRVHEIGRDELGFLARSINRMAAELEQNIEAERRAERTKDELITGVSHDLRTPLTSIKGYLHLLHTRKSDSPEETERYVRIAYAKAEQLQEMVESLFEYTKLSGQEARLNKQEICLRELLEQMAEEYVPLSEGNLLTFTKSLPNKHAHVSADPDRLARVFDNLLTNAIKYGDKSGLIEVRLAVQDGGFAVTVQNRGPVIAEGDLERLFNPFFRLDRARSEAAGSGLGLAVAKSIVELHGGRIWADCEGGFVRLHVWLPFSTSELLNL